MIVTEDRLGGARATGPHDSDGSGETADAHHCHCGEPLQRCGDCRDLRCLRCDPYRSDDCRSDR